MFTLEYSLADLKFEKILKNKTRMKGILDEPSCRASMKNSVIKDDRKKEKLKTQGEALQ